MDNAELLHVRRIFGGRMGYANRHWRRMVDERLQPFGLTEAMWLPLVYVARGGAPMRQKALADLIGIQGSTLVRLIDALVRRGLIERRTDGDRRAKLICLTTAGGDLVVEVEAVIAEVREQILAGIGDDELAAALDVVERICVALDRARDHTDDSR